MSVIDLIYYEYLFIHVSKWSNLYYEYLYMSPIDLIYYEYVYMSMFNLIYNVLFKLWLCISTNKLGLHNKY